MSRKKQRAKHRPQFGHDSHHLLFCRRLWDVGYKQMLRRAFIYELPLEVHQALHQAVRPVPPLDEEDAKWLWHQYVAEHRNMELFEALDWLRLHAPNSEFAIAIIEQQGFLQNNL